MKPNAHWYLPQAVSEEYLLLSGAPTVQQEQKPGDSVMRLDGR